MKDELTLLLYRKGVYIFGDNVGGLHTWKPLDLKTPVPVPYDDVFYVPLPGGGESRIYMNWVAVDGVIVSSFGFDSATKSWYRYMWPGPGGNDVGSAWITTDTGEVLQDYPQ